MSFSLNNVVLHTNKKFTSNTTSFIYLNPITHNLLYHSLKESKINKQTKEKAKEEAKKQKQAREEARLKKQQRDWEKLDRNIETPYITIRKMPTIVHITCYDPYTKQVKPLQEDDVYSDFDREDDF